MRYGKPQTKLAAQRLVIAVGLAVAVLWSYSHLVVSRHRALRETRSADRTEDLALQVKSLQRRPVLVANQELQQPELARKIEAALKASDVSTATLERVTPGPAHRVGNSDYKAKPTNVLLRGLSLAQAVDFLYRLTHQEAATVHGVSAIPGRALPTAAAVTTAKHDPAHGKPPAPAPDGTSGMHLVVTSLHLSAPHEDTSAGLWRVETTLTYLVYAPQHDNLTPDSGER